MRHTENKHTVFLDRDGVINRDSPEYVKSWKEFEFLPGSLRALKMLTEAGFRIIVVSNQSAVGRGIITAETLENTFARMRGAIETAGGRIHDVLHCPHAPDVGCGCRKPGPGMILQASARHGVDLQKSVMVGDSAGDIECGKAAGCGKTVLVRTGIRLNETLRALADKHLRPDYTADDLSDAAKWIIGKHHDSGIKHAVQPGP